jgi:hypothetical protein
MTFHKSTASAFVIWTVQVLIQARWESIMDSRPVGKAQGSPLGGTLKWSEAALMLILAAHPTQLLQGTHNTGTVMFTCSSSSFGCNLSCITIINTNSLHAAWVEGVLWQER